MFAFLFDAFHSTYALEIEAEYACDGEAVNCVAASSIFSANGNDAVLGCDDMTIRVM